MTATAMHTLTFRLSDDTYGLPLQRVAQVVPKVPLRVLPHAPAAVAGIFTYQGRLVPVIDLGLLLTGRPCADRYSTRIIVAHYTSAAGSEHLLGLLAEGVTEIVDVAADTLQASGVETPEAPYLGLLAPSTAGLVQHVTIDDLLPADLQRLLFTNEDDAP